jgi:hypothetical protein
MQFEKSIIVKVKMNLSSEDSADVYSNKLQWEIEGPLFDVLSRLFKEVIKINIIIPSDYKTTRK